MLTKMPRRVFLSAGANRFVFEFSEVWEFKEQLSYALITLNKKRNFCREPLGGCR